MLSSFFDQISQDTGKFVFGVKDTLACLEMGAVETLILWENLEYMRYVLKTPAGGWAASSGRCWAAAVWSVGLEMGRGAARGWVGAEACGLRGVAGRRVNLLAAGRAEFSGLNSPAPPLLHPPPPGVEDVKYLSKEQETQAQHFKDKESGADLDVVDKQPMLEWIANSYKKFGCTLEFVTDRSQEGSQFCRGFGGIGGILRYSVDLTEFEEAGVDVDSDAWDSEEDFI